MALGAAPSTPAPYTTRLQKGGALVADMRALLLAWSDAPGCADALIARNALGHDSRARARDVLQRVFIPRFVRSTPPDLWRPMAVFERAGVDRDVTLALHFHLAAEAEPLLGEFAAYLHADRGPEAVVSTDDVIRFLQRAPRERFPEGRWSVIPAVKVARGVLAALRDFGHLRGEHKKFLAVPRLPPLAVAFIAAHRVACGAVGARILRDPAWARFGLDERRVELALFDCHARGMLEYHAAGSVVRLEFAAGSLEDLAHVLVEGRARSARSGAATQSPVVPGP